MYSSNLWIFQELKEQLEQIKEGKEYFNKPTDFTRDRTFTFETIFHMILDLPSLSLNLEMEKTLRKVNKVIGIKEEGTKSGFCKAREKIKPELFTAVNNNLHQLIYQKQKGLKRWKGFILKGIDGSMLDIVDTPENKKEFGLQRNQHVEVVQGRMMICYDLLNRIITHSNLGHLSIGEGTVVKGWVSSMKSDELNIYDRLFPGMSLQYLHNYHNKSYVMRCKVSHNKQIREFIESGRKEKTEEWALTKEAITELKKKDYKVTNKTRIPVRMIRVELDNGEVEILITNLLKKKKYPHKIFKELYFKRWGVETINGFLKNTLQIEISSGQKSKTIYQDFYATILRSNIQAIIELDCHPKIEEVNHRRKHNYAINRTAAAGNLKGKIVQLFLGTNPEKIYEDLIEVFTRYLEPIRLNRLNPRNKRFQKLNGKYKPYRNYKRAM